MTGRCRLRARSSALLAAALTLTAATAGCTSQRAHPGSAPTARGPAIVLPGGDAAAWVRLLRASGVEAHSGALPNNVGTDQLLVVPIGAARSERDLHVLTSAVHHGTSLVTADTAVLRRLGVRVGAPVDAHGLLVAVGADPVAGGRTGFELMPDLGRQVAALSAAMPTPQRLGVDVYLDPGTLAPDERDPTAIAARLAGVRSVRVAAWDLFDDRSADYNYAGLVRALHARGILAYAWLEPPFVSLRLWTHHPECREKNRAGHDAIGDWRRLIALEDRPCFVLAAQEWRAQLTDAAWDGVDIAELYFEQGPAATETPYSAAALASFGHAPAHDAAGFAAFRTQLATQLNRQVLAQVAGYPHAQARELVLTVIDDTLDPGLAHRVGQDLPTLAAVARDAGATLNVEDPFSQWAEGPLRYSKITARLAGGLSPDGAWMVDVNVVDRPGARPTSRPAGAELDLAELAAGAGGRVALYTASTVTGDDLTHAARALGSRATYDGHVVRTPWTVTVSGPGTGADSRLRVDGIQWPCADGTAVVPAGRHTLDWSGGHPAGPGLARLAAELGTAATSPGAVRFSYFSRAQTYVVVTQRPNGLRVDGALVVAHVTDDPGGGWSLALPSGQHEVLISTSS